MDDALLKQRHYVSAPSYVAINDEKNLLFHEREKEIWWTEEELLDAEIDKEFFFIYGLTGEECGW